MKKVFDNSQVAHIWANQTQDEGRNSANNLFFDNKTIYSYGHHFAIAKHITSPKGEKGTLFTQRTYSNTTAKQVSLVRHAANHLNLIYCYNPLYSHAENFKQWLYEIESIAANLPKAKKPEKYLIQISQVADTVKKYAEFFEIETPAKLTLALSIANKEEFTQYADNKAAIEKEEKRKAELKNKAEHKKALTKWLNFKTSLIYSRDGYDYLRLNKEENRVETTQGVKIPLEIGKRIYNSINNNTLKRGDKILDYTVDNVGKEIKVGCHNFKTSYLLKFGAAL